MIRRAAGRFCTVISTISALACVANASALAATNHLAPKARTAVHHAHLAVATPHTAKVLIHATTKAVAPTRLVRGANGKLVRVAARHRSYERFSGNSFADNVTFGDVTEGEDPIVRAAAVEALGNMNGTAVAIDPATGRILAMVNQKLALSGGAEPCSTIKLTVALAALQRESSPARRPWRSAAATTST